MRWTTILVGLVGASPPPAPEEEKSRVTFINAMDQGVNVYYGGLEGRGILKAAGGRALVSAGEMMCVGSLRPGFEVAVDVGRVGDVYYGETTDGGCVAGSASSDATRWTAWRHSKPGPATVVLAEERGLGMMESEEGEVAELAWREGIAALFEGLDSARAARYLRVAAALGDPTGTAVLALASAANVAAPVPVVALLRRSSGSWLAKLALGTMRAEGRLVPRDCAVARRHLEDLLSSVARPGIGSPEKALVKPRHAYATPNELLVDHWVRADGYAALKEEVPADDDSTILADDDENEAYLLSAGAGPEDRAALAELLLGGFEGVEVDVDRAFSLVNDSATSPFGLLLRAHVLELRGADATPAFEEAASAGSPEARVSLAIRLLDSDPRRARLMLRAALDDDSSLTAALTLAERLEDCEEAAATLLDAVRHATWDTEDAVFGAKRALAAAAASWRVSGPDDDPSCPEQPGLLVDLLEELRSHEISRRGCVRSTRARTIGAYRMFATLGAAGIPSADVNAGFLANRLGYDERVARRHFEAALGDDDANDTPVDPSTPLLPRLRALFRAEAARSLAATSPPDDARRLLERAADLGSEWAAFDLAVDATKRGDLQTARDLVSRCAHHLDWPHRVPCDLYLFALQIGSRLLLLLLFRR